VEEEVKETPGEHSIGRRRQGLIGLTNHGFTWENASYIVPDISKPGLNQSYPDMEIQDLKSVGSYSYCNWGLLLSQPTKEFHLDSPLPENP